MRSVDVILHQLATLAGKSGDASQHEWDILSLAFVDLLEAGHFPTDSPLALGQGNRAVGYPGMTDSSYRWEPFRREWLSLPRGWTLQTIAPGSTSHVAVHYRYHGDEDRRIPFRT